MNEYYLVYPGKVDFGELLIAETESNDIEDAKKFASEFSSITKDEYTILEYVPGRKFRVNGEKVEEEK